MKADRELYKKIEHRDIRDKVLFFALPDDTVCNRPVKGEKDRLDRELLCPTRHKHKRGSKR